MRPPLDGHVLVTGASSGIGREIARLLAPQATSLVLVARRRGRLEALSQELMAAYPELSVTVAACDLGDSESLEAFVDGLGQVDVLVNNAGLGDIALFEHTSWDKLSAMVRVNVTALTYLTHRLLPGMLERKRGGVLNVSSGFGVTVMPASAAYCGTKHYVTAFSESLRMELVGTGVVVSQLCPGPVATEFESVAGNPTGMKVPWWFELSVERCAAAAVRGFARGRARIYPGVIPAIAIAMGAWTPRWLLRLVYWPVAGWLRRRAA